ncbi:MAG: RNA 2',3'-cyclic phosphodiesterase [Pseudazoarcus pumilus]|nr:RNA 2',3'-cyclic phosphodiesterase [Pseudazoarcus pumilus]
MAGSLQPRFGGRVMRMDSLHLTLAFVGGVPRARIPELIAAGAQLSAAAFDLKLDVLGEWARKHIVWAGPADVPAALATLAAELQQTLSEAGFALEARPFVPHVTLLRNAACETRRTPLEQPVRWRSDGFVLVESSLQPSGARYLELARWAA